MRSIVPTGARQRESSPRASGPLQRLRLSLINSCYAAYISTNESRRTVDAFLTASRALVGISARSLGGVEDDVTLPQFRALVVLLGKRGVTVNELAERLDIHPSSATRLCDRLVRKDLIRRVEGETDRRETKLGLTPAGRRLVSRVTARRRRDLEAIVRRMTDDERRHAIEGLSAFAAAAGEIADASLFGWPDATATADAHADADAAPRSSSSERP